MLTNCTLTLNSVSPCSHTIKKRILQTSDTQTVVYIHVHDLCCVSKHQTCSESNLSQYQPRISTQTPILSGHPCSYVYFKQHWLSNIPYSLHSRPGRRHGTRGLHGNSRLQCSRILPPSDWTRSGHQCYLLDRKLGNFVLLTRQVSYWIRHSINVKKKKKKLNKRQPSM